MVGGRGKFPPFSHRSMSTLVQPSRITVLTGADGRERTAFLHIL
jgi:hypothetical protein